VPASPWTADFRARPELLSIFLRVLPAHYRSVSAQQQHVWDQLFDLLAKKKKTARTGEAPGGWTRFRAWVLSRSVLARMQFACCHGEEVCRGPQPSDAHALSKSVCIWSAVMQMPIISEDDTSVERLLQASTPPKHCGARLSDPV